MIKLYKILFCLTMIMGTLISISSYSWLNMWVGLEINLLSIIPLMNNKKISLSSESSIKYFITQSLASTIILFAIILMSWNIISYLPLLSNWCLIMNVALFTKMGAAPFHFWFPEIMEGLDWFNSFLILTWQKIAPMVILMTNMFSIKFVCLIILISLLIGGLMGFNQTSLRKILAYSSINHIGWMASGLMLNFKLWIIYFLVYSIISFMFIYYLSYFNIFNVSQMLGQAKLNEDFKFSFNINLLSMGGLPPFIGFLPKWLMINEMMNTNFTILAIMMVLLTMITLFYYIRVSVNSFLISISMLNFSLSFKNNKFLLYVFNFINIMGLILMVQMINLI